MHRAFEKTRLADPPSGSSASVNFAIAFMSLLVNPGMGHVGDLGDEGKFFAAETGRGLPFVAVFVKPSDGDIVARAVVRFVCPDGRLDAAHADFVNGLLLRVIGAGLLLRALVVGHCTVLSLKREKGMESDRQREKPGGLLIDFGAFTGERHFASHAGESIDHGENREASLLLSDLQSLLGPVAADTALDQRPS